MTLLERNVVTPVCDNYISNIYKNLPRFLLNVPTLIDLETNKSVQCFWAIHAWRNITG